VRPTSETIIGHACQVDQVVSRFTSSLISGTVSCVGNCTKLFLHLEFWQEGHSTYQAAEEAETRQMLDI